MIVSHCQAELPREACGLLAGVKSSKEFHIKSVQHLRNVAASGFLYEVNAEDLYKAFKKAEEEGLEVLGFYHSHPLGGVQPSEVDREKAAYPGLVYLILSPTRDDWKVGAYLWTGGWFKEVSVIVEE